MTLSLTFWDVKHGSSTFIKTPHGRKFIFDLGVGALNNSYDFSPIQHLRNNYNISEIDELIITHPDLDHIQDITSLLVNGNDYSKTKVICFRRPNQIPIEVIEEKKNSCRNHSESECFSRYLEMNSNYNSPIDDHYNPENSLNNGGVSFDFYYPTPDISTSIENNYSIVSIIEYLGIKILIPGDNERSSWKFLLENSSFVRNLNGIDIFIASHHGRESGYYSELFDYFTPKLVIISDGPETTTSVTNFYSKHASGWYIYKNGIREFRKCLTTRNDGAINIEIGNDSDSEKYLNVKGSR